MAQFYRVHEAAVLGYMAPGGEVAEVMRGISVDARNSAIAFAPVGKTATRGKLKRNIRAGNYVNTGAYKGTVVVSCNVKYARWVHDGTPMWIYPNKSKVLRFKSDIPNRKGQFFIYAKKVRGQVANPFLAKGMAAAMAKFRAGG